MKRLFLLVLLLAPATALGKDPPTRKVGLHRDAWLGVSVSIQDLFGPRDVERLRSGFVVRVVVRVEVLQDKVLQPVARQDRRSEILFDLWDERFKVRVIDRHGPTERQVASANEAIEAATVLQRFEVAELARLKQGVRYRLRVRADLNPLSEDLVADVRKWVIKTPGQGKTGTGDSVFGSFVSFFVNPRIEESERQILFLSQYFDGPTRPEIDVAGGKR